MSIPLYLITGFLGSGKTTLLKRMINQINRDSTLSETPSRIGIIENEFGEVGVDGKLIGKNSVKMTEIDNGSIFCSCRSEEFMRALQKLSHYDFRFMFVESSGISDPSPIKNNVKVVNTLVDSKYDYKGTICVIDASTFLDMVEMLESLVRQVKHADVILLNKVDLVHETDLVPIQEKIAEIRNNDLPHIIETEYCDVDLKHILRALTKSSEIKPEKGTNTPQNQPLKLTLSTSRVLSGKDLEHFFSHFAANTFRIKGFARLESGLTYVDGVGAEIKFEPFEDDYLETEKPTQIVVILNRGDPLGNVILEAWNDHFDSNEKHAH